MKLLQLGEYDELPPPPPQLIPAGGGIGDGYNNTTSTGSFGDDSTSEEGKLLACVRDDSVTYASTRDLEPPTTTTPPPPPLPTHTTNQQPTGISSANINTAGANGLTEMCISGGNVGKGGSDVTTTVMAGRAPQAIPENMQLSSSPEHLVSPLAPVTVTVHTNEAHVSTYL